MGRITRMFYEKIRQIRAIRVRILDLYGREFIFEKHPQGKPCGCFYFSLSFKLPKRLFHLQGIAAEGLPALLRQT